MKGTLRKLWLGVKYGGGLKGWGAGWSDCPEAAGEGQQENWEESEAGEDPLFTALRENKRAAGFPNHRQINETHFKSQTKVLRLLHASV